MERVYADRHVGSIIIYERRRMCLMVGLVVVALVEGACRCGVDWGGNDGVKRGDGRGNSQLGFV